MNQTENKIAPYMNNYGQKIINQSADLSKLKELLKQINDQINKETKNKYEIEFLDIIKNEDKVRSFFTYIELFKILRQKNITKSIKYLHFRFMFNLASNKRKKFDFPPYLLIEPNAACNLKCPMCFQIDKSFTRKPFMGIMKWELFKKVVDEANEIGVGAITLASRGEPLMHPKFSDMIKYISKKENIFELKINTNGSFLNEKICHDIFKSKVTTVVISADHYEKEKFEELRKNSKYEQIIENVKLLYSIREKFYPDVETEIRISGVDFYKELDREKFENFWKPISDNVSVSNPVERWDTYNNPRIENMKSPCTFWDRMYVWHDGKVNPCDADYKSYLTYGNVKDKTIYEVWNGEKINSHRKKHLDGNRTDLTPCDRCGIEFN